MFLSRNSSQIDIINPTLDENKINELDDLFRSFISQLKDEVGLLRYEHNMTSIYDALQQVLKNENNLINIFTKLKIEHSELNQKYVQALKLSTKDQTTKADLLEQLENSWKQEKAARSKEKRTLETLNSLKLEISNLSKLVEQVVGLTMGQEYNLRELIKEKENLVIDNRILNNDCENFKLRIREFNLKESEQDKIVEEAKIKVNQAEQDLLICKIKNQQLLRRIEKLEEDNLIIKRSIDHKEANITVLNQTLTTFKFEAAKSDQNIKDYLQIIEKLKKENDLLSNRILKLQNELEQQFIKNDSVLVENSQLLSKLKFNDDLIEKLKLDTITSEKLKDSYEKRLVILEKEKNEFIIDKQLIASDLDVSNKQCDKLKKEIEIFDKKIKTQIIEKDQLCKDINKLKLKLEDLETELNNSKLKIKTNKIGKDNSDKIIENFELKIINFDKERSNYSKTKNDFLNKIENLNHKIKLKDRELNKKEKKQIDYEIKLEKLSKLYELVRLERNQLSKLNNESKEQLSLLKDQNKNLKLDLDGKTTLIKHTKTDYDNLCHINSKLEKNLIKYRQESDNNLLEISEYNKKCSDFKTNEQNLLQIINDLNKSIGLKTKAYEKIELERNIFGTQLVRRNDEISLLYEKIKLIENLNNNGEQKFKKCYSILKLSEKNLITLRKEKDIIVNENKDLKKCKHDLFVAQEQVHLERAKRDISEKYHNSYKLHKWRKLRGSNPLKFDLITKCNILQKKLISKTVEISKLNLKFQEKDRLFIELNKCLSRRLIKQDASNLDIEHQLAINARNNQIKVRKKLNLKLLIEIQYS